MANPRPSVASFRHFVVALCVLGFAVACAAKPEARWPGTSAGCPEGMVNVEGAFCIDRFEASLVEVTPQGERPFSPYEQVRGRSVRAVSRAGVVPQAYLSRNEAAAACRAAGKRLCREDEWTRACRGPTSTTFPYGSKEVRRVCNDSGEAPLVRIQQRTNEPLYGDNAMNDPRLNQLSGTVKRSGEQNDCVSGYGTFDMVGNLHEWVDDPGGTFLGGYYLDTKLNGPGCRYKTTAHDAAYHDYSTGFRCCAQPR